MPAQSVVISPGDDVLADQYNNLRIDVLDGTLGHGHTGGSDGKLIDDVDKVDGIHASATPTPNYLLPLDATGMFPFSVLRTHGTLQAKVTYIFGGFDTPNVYYDVVNITGKGQLLSVIGHVPVGWASTVTIKITIDGQEIAEYSQTYGAGGGQFGVADMFGYIDETGIIPILNLEYDISLLIEVKQSAAPAGLGRITSYVWYNKVT